jgi:NDP-sugar pyrophosphorylase family protein
LGTAGPLRLLQADMKEPFLVINGDILTLANFRGIFDFGLKSQAPLTVVIKKEILPFAFGNVLFSGDFVTDVLEKPDLVLYIVAGIYVATPGVFPLIPPNEYYGMDLLIKSMLSQKIPVAKYELKEYWLDIGRLNDYEKAQSDYREHFRPKNS